MTSPERDREHILSVKWTNQTTEMTTLTLFIRTRSTFMMKISSLQITSSTQSDGVRRRRTDKTIGSGSICSQAPAVKFDLFNEKGNDRSHWNGAVTTTTDGRGRRRGRTRSTCMHAFVDGSRHERWFAKKTPFRALKIKSEPRNDQMGTASTSCCIHWI